MDGNAFRVGCCGIPVSQARYKATFPVLEINSSFYQLPRLETAQKWRAFFGPDFEFTLKAWQLITHPPTSSTYKRLSEKIPERKKNRYGSFLPTREVEEAWEKTLAVARALKATIVLFQCPASFIPTADNVGNLRAFFKRISRALGNSKETLRFAWEPRGEWPGSLIERIRRDCDLIHAVDPLRHRPATGAVNYFRLHGSYLGNRPQASHVYTDSELREVVRRCDKRLNYVFFNNLFMFTDARRFGRLLSPPETLRRKPQAVLLAHG